MKLLSQLFPLPRFILLSFIRHALECTPANSRVWGPWYNILCRRQTSAAAPVAQVGTGSCCSGRNDQTTHLASETWALMPASFEAPPPRLIVLRERVGQRECHVVSGPCPCLWGRRKASEARGILKGVELHHWTSTHLLLLLVVQNPIKRYEWLCEAGGWGRLLFLTFVALRPCALRPGVLQRVG